MRRIGLFVLMLAMPNPAAAQIAAPPPDEQPATTSDAAESLPAETPETADPGGSASGMAGGGPVVLPDTQSQQSPAGQPPSTVQPAASDGGNGKGLWDYLPAVLGAIAAVITALAALIGVTRRRGSDN